MGECFSNILISGNYQPFIITLLLRESQVASRVVHIGSSSHALSRVRHLSGISEALIAYKQVIPQSKRVCKAPSYLNMPMGNRVA